MVICLVNVFIVVVILQRLSFGTNVKGNPFRCKLLLLFNLMKDYIARCCGVLVIMIIYKVK